MKRNKKNDTFHLQSFSKQKLRWLANLSSTIVAMSHLPHFYYTHFEITGCPCNLISSNWCDLFTNRSFFCFKSNLVPSQ